MTAISEFEHAYNNTYKHTYYTCNTFTCSKEVRLIPAYQNYSCGSSLHESA